MSSLRGGLPLHHRRIGRADLAAVQLLDLDPDQVERFLGPLPEILETVRRGPLHSLIGVEAAGRPIGFYVLHPDRRDAACWWLGWLAISRSQQGMGHGRRIMEAVIARLRLVPGCRRIRLLVAPDNPGALRLYQRAGFRLQATWPATGELLLECALDGGQPYELLAPQSLGRRFSGRDEGHLRLRPPCGPHAARVIGVERGPPG
ncbi:GNAT family N-acetyltransferase [Roseococcus sp. YIM B11640]|uniref:GNAT family N-acetyltransferase n=1 Tax=Roseococcus sp. YIM B11640 TaxID=3133973 RepID=UPI003C7CBE3E